MKPSKNVYEPCAEEEHEDHPYIHMKFIVNDKDVESEGGALWETTEDNQQPPWKELNVSQKSSSCVMVIVKVLLTLCLWYIFICSLDLLGSAFHLVGARAAGSVFANPSILHNPLCGVMIGILMTVTLQSSTTSTTLAVTMVATEMLTVPEAIPLVLGANIGTTVTGVLVSLTQSGQDGEYRRAFTAATLHSLFNLFTVLVLLPLEVASGYLAELSSQVVKSMNVKLGAGPMSLQYVITRPLTDLVVQLDYDVIAAIAGNNPIAAKRPMLKEWCETEAISKNLTFSKGQENMTVLEEVIGDNPYTNITSGNDTAYIYNETIGVKSCSYLLRGHTSSETADGLFLLMCSLIILCFSLLTMAKVLQSLLRNKYAHRLCKWINADFPGKFSCLTGYVAILVGSLLTFLAQGSSAFTSTLIPLAGLGVVSVDRAYPLILGANVGTTARSIMAAMSGTGNHLHNALQLAFCQLFFNVSGVLLFYPIPVFRSLPLKLAKIFGNTTARYRWFGLAYLLILYFVLPGAIFGLSMAGWPVLVGVGAPTLVFLGVFLTTRILCQNGKLVKLETVKKSFLQLKGKILYIGRYGHLTKQDKPPIFKRP